MANTVRSVTVKVQAIYEGSDPFAKLVTGAKQAETAAEKVAAKVRSAIDPSGMSSAQPFRQIVGPPMPAQTSARLLSGQADSLTAQVRAGALPPANAGMDALRRQADGLKSLGAGAKIAVDADVQPALARVAEAVRQIESRRAVMQVSGNVVAGSVPTANVPQQRQPSPLPMAIAPSVDTKKQWEDSQKAATAATAAIYGGAGRATESVLMLGRGLTSLYAGQKGAEEMIRTFLMFQGAVDLFRGLTGTIGGLTQIMGGLAARRAITTTAAVAETVATTAEGAAHTGAAVATTRHAVATTGATAAARQLAAANLQVTTSLASNAVALRTASAQMTAYTVQANAAGGANKRFGGLGGAGGILGAGLVGGLGTLAAGGSGTDALVNTGGSMLGMWGLGKLFGGGAAATAVGGGGAVAATGAGTGGVAAGATAAGAAAIPAAVIAAIAVATASVYVANNRDAQNWIVKNRGYIPGSGMLMGDIGTDPDEMRKERQRLRTERTPDQITAAQLSLREQIDAMRLFGLKAPKVEQEKLQDIGLRAPFEERLRAIEQTRGAMRFDAGNAENEARRKADQLQGEKQMEIVQDRIRAMTADVFKSSPGEVKELGEEFKKILEGAVTGINAGGGKIDLDVGRKSPFDPERLRTSRELRQAQDELTAARRQRQLRSETMPDGKGGQEFKFSFAERSETDRQHEIAVSRVLDLEMKTLQVKRDQSLAESERLSRMKQFAAEQERAIENQLKQERARLETFREQFGFTDSMTRSAIRDVAKKIGAGKPLTKEEMEIAQQSVLRESPKLQDTNVKTANVEGFDEILKQAGYADRIVRTEAALKQATELRVTAENKVVANFTFDAKDLVKTFEEYIVPLLKEREAGTRIQMEAALNKIRAEQFLRNAFPVIGP